jgi:predicted phage terminase large subunit-like protein
MKVDKDGEPVSVEAPKEENLVDDSIFSDTEFEAVMGTILRAAKEDFPSFLHTVWPQVPGEKSAYVISAFHQYLAELVQDVATGLRSPNQSVSVPPQHGKSRLLSVRAVAWIVGHSPGIHIALTGFNFSLLADFLREIKDIIASPIYHMIFPGVTPIEGYNRQGSVMFSNGTSVQVTSAGSKLTGRRVDWLIIDDPHAGRFEAESPGARKKVEQWFYGDCISRLSPDAKVFLVSTRWHVEDLHGVVTDPKNTEALVEAGFSDQLFEVTNLPAIAESDDDPLGRKIGDALFPEQRPVRFLQAVKLKMPGFEWDSQYRGDPRMSMGEVVDVAKIRRIELSEVPTNVEWYRGWDPAITDSTAADFTAGALCCCVRDRKGEVLEFYVIDMVYGQMAWAKMRFTVVETAKNDLRRGVACRRMGLEGVGGFKAVFEDVKRELSGQVKVEPRNFRGGKLLRAQSWLNLVEAGRVSIVKAPWNKDFLLELERFPLGKHDDMVDAVSIAKEGLDDYPRIMLA